MPETYIRNPNAECSICKVQVYRRPSQIQRNDGNIFCSQKCYGIYCRKELPCLVCKKMILAGLHKKTCSRSCSNIYRTGIKYKLGRPRDKAEEIRGIKIRLLKHRGEKCERCQYPKKEILEVHHKNRNRKDNSDGNLEIICPNCHAMEHYLHGK
jgi:hypothetical protein